LIFSRNAAWSNAGTVIPLAISPLSPEQIRWVLGLLKEHSINYVVFEESADHLEGYHMLLELEKTGYWTCFPIEDGQPVGKSLHVAV
jgi:hypothetical protein